MKVNERLLVVWTHIDGSGTATLKAKSADVSDLKTANWVDVPLQATGDHPQLVRYMSHQAVLGYLEPVGGRNELRLANFVADPCSHGFAPPFDPMLGINDITSFDLATMQYDPMLEVSDIAIVTSRQEQSFNIIDVYKNQFVTKTPDSYQCNGMPAPVAYDRWAASDYQPLGRFDDGDRIDPTIGLWLVDRDGIGEFRTSVHVAWHERTSRSDQIVARTLNPANAPQPGWQPIGSQFVGEASRESDTISDTVGYASSPEFRNADGQMFLAWSDESVHHDESGRGSLYTLQATAGSTLLVENQRGDASGAGISVTGGVVRSLSLSVPWYSRSRYVVWTDAIGDAPQVMLRHDLFGGIRPDVAKRQNRLNRFDVNNDGRTTPLDALLVINQLARGDLENLPDGVRDRIEVFLDVTGDDSITPLDALQVINRLSRQIPEGEFESPASPMPLSLLSDEEEHDAAFRDWEDWW